MKEENYKHLLYIMKETSVERNESDEDIEEFLKNTLLLNPSIVRCMKEEFLKSSKDENWNWLKANEETRFIPKDFQSELQVQEAFIEIVLNVLFPNEEWE